MVILKAQPSLLAKSVSSVVMPSWEPQPTVQYFCVLSQLTFLCSSVDIDSQFKSALKALIGSATEGSDVKKNETDRIKVEASTHSLMGSFVQAMVPVGESWSFFTVILY
jgi:hypothetical protein